MKKNYDVIVIGAGNGGLAAALAVLNKGKTCLVLEKHNIPGGFATSFVRGRFEFEASLHEFNGIGTKEEPGSCGVLFNALGVSDKIEWVPLHEAYRLISLEENIDVTVPLGKDKVIALGDKLCEGGSKYMKDFLELAGSISDAMTYLGECHGKPDPNVMKTKYINYMTTCSYSFKEVMDKLNYPSIIRKVLTGYWSYLGAKEDDMSFVHLANMINSYFTKGACIPTLRSHGLSLAFEERIHELGGDIYFNSKVAKILTDETGHVSGVRLVNGQEYYTRHVIANCSPHNVFSTMLDKKAIPERALKLTNYRKFAGRGFTVFLGLNKSPKELGINEHSYFIYSSSDNIKVYKEMGKLPHTAGQATVCLNNALPDCSPKGTTILYITTLFTEDAWSKVSEKDYVKMKNQMAEGLIKQFEDALHINLHDHIEELAIASPITYAHYCLHPQGVIYGYYSQYNDGLMYRIQMVNEDAYVPGLRIGGGYGERLDGFPSSYKSGANEGARTLGDIAKEGK
ncbi:MAG: FAD-dependent oxidoreductase [Bacilli bacterium]|nr:FAD-dependent oxidoreductase [Bacilli bacterium]